jgi:hypothetical protein
LYSSPKHIRLRIKWVGHAVHITEIRNPFNILVRKPKGRDLFGDLIKMDPKQTELEDTDWLHLDERDWGQAVPKMVMNLQVPQKAVS